MKTTKTDKCSSRNLLSAFDALLFVEISPKNALLLIAVYCFSLVYSFSFIPLFTPMCPRPQVFQLQVKFILYWHLVAFNF